MRSCFLLVCSRRTARCLKPKTAEAICRKKCSANGKILRCCCGRCKWFTGRTSPIRRRRRIIGTNAGWADWSSTLAETIIFEAKRTGTASFRGRKSPPTPDCAFGFTTNKGIRRSKPAGSCWKVTRSWSPKNSSGTRTPPSRSRFATATNLPIRAIVMLRPAAIRIRSIRRRPNGSSK